MPPFNLSYGIATEIGTAHPMYSDRVVARTGSDNIHLFIAARCITLKGKQASELALQIVCRHVDNYFQVGDLEHKAEHKLFSLLKNAFQTAHREILKQAPDSLTTLTAALVIGESLYIAHVGDSRAYLISHRESHQLTLDHTYSAELVRRGILTQEQLLTTENGGMLLIRHLGIVDNLEIDTRLTNLTSGTWLLLCTKGFWMVVTDEETYPILAQNEPQLAADLLVGLANAREPLFNASVIVVSIK